MIARFFASRRAATSIEYAMIAGLISVIIVVAASQIGLKINAKFYGPLMSAFQ